LFARGRIRPAAAPGLAGRSGPAVGVHAVSARLTFCEIGDARSVREARTRSTRARRDFGRLCVEPAGLAERGDLYFLACSSDSGRPRGDAVESFVDLAERCGLGELTWRAWRKRLAALVADAVEIHSTLARILA